VGFVVKGEELMDLEMNMRRMDRKSAGDEVKWKWCYASLMPKL
jgi:hypothetical protein